MNSNLIRLTEITKNAVQLEKKSLSFTQKDEAIWNLSKDHNLHAVWAPWILKDSSWEEKKNESQIVWQVESLRQKAYQTEFKKIHAAAQGLRLTPLKGLYLCQQAYPCQGQRTFKDIDLITLPQQLKKVTEIILAQGYRIVTERDQLQPKGSSIQAAQSGLEAVTFQKQDFTIELHTVIIPPELSNYTIEWKEEKNELCDEDTLAHLFFHTSRHHFNSGLRHIFDIALWAQNRKIDFKKLQRKLDQSQSHSIAYPAWKIAHDYFPQLLPEPSKKNVSIFCKRYTYKCHKLLLSMPKLAKTLQGNPIVFYASSTMSVYKKMNVIMGSKTKREYQAGSQLSKGEKISWYVKRPIHLMRRHGLRTLQLLKFLV